MTVPFLNLKAQYESIGNEITDAIQQVMDRTAFAGGPFVEQFEKEFADFCQCRHAIGVGSGTEALWLTLLTLGIGHDDEVITVPNTFIATAEAISFCDATPVFADVDKKTYTMDPELFEAAITPRTKAVIPVHLFGQMADMDPIMEIAKAHGLFVIEDACRSMALSTKSKLAGSVGDAGCFSFYPGKIWEPAGEAGAVTTNNAELADKIRILRDHGQSEKYHHSMIGWNARMDGLQGAILSVKLKHLAEWNNQRRSNARIYNELMGCMNDVIIPKEADHNRHVYHIYGICVQNRDTLMSALMEKDIYCGIHYPVPIHLTEAYQALGYGKGDFPVAEKCAKELLSLPMFPELKREQLEKVTYEISQLV